MTFIKTEDSWMKKISNIRHAIEGTKNALLNLETMDERRQAQIEAHEAQIKTYENALLKANVDYKAWSETQPAKMSIKMNRLDFDATLVFRKLIMGLDDDKKTTQRFDKHNYWPDCSGGFMAVHVEKIDFLYSVAHYYKQNGDLMSDPEMTFVVFDDLVYPVSFTQHNIGLYEESMVWTNGGWTLDPTLQKQHADFANLWFENIKIQQEI